MHEYLQGALLLIFQKQREYVHHNTAESIVLVYFQFYVMSKIAEVVREDTLWPLFNSFQFSSYLGAQRTVYLMLG